MTSNLPSLALQSLAAAIRECLKSPGDYVISRYHATVANLALAEIISQVEVLEQTQMEATALARQLRHAEATIDRLSKKPLYAVPLDMDLELAREAVSLDPKIKGQIEAKVRAGAAK